MQLANTINDKLSKNSSCEAMFNESKHQYKEKPNKGGYNTNLVSKNPSPSKKPS